jgi:predicted permease
MGSAQWDTVSLPDLRDYARLTNVFSGVVGSQITPACLVINGKQEWAYGQITTANFFAVLGVKPLLGRTFIAEEDLAPGGAPVLVLSEAFWRGRFAGDLGIIGRTVELNRHTFTVVGVVASPFQGTMSPLRFDFWAPVTMHQQVANFGSLNSRSDHWLHTQARLKPGISLGQAQAAVDLLAHQLEAAYPGTNKEIGLRVLPLWNSPYGGQRILLPVLRILMAVSLGVLLIVAANVANLLLARAATRQKEIAIRLAMGASRARLVRQLLVESVVLALLGGAAGLWFIHPASLILRGLTPTTHLPITFQLGLDATTVGFTLLITLLTALLFGLAPALRAARPNLYETLKEGGRTSGGTLPHHGLRSALVVSEVALALLLLVGATLCIKGARNARRIDVGFDPHGVLVAGLRIGMNGYDEKTGLVFYRQLRERLAVAPGVRSVGLASWFPLGFEGGPSLDVEADGYDRRPNEDVSVPYSIVSPGYFDTLRIPLLAGREFTDRDDQTTPGVALINETMARRFWPGQDPIGRKFHIWRGDMTVVGVVKAGFYRYLNERPQEFFYLPYLQGVWDLNLGVAVRTEGDPRAFLSTLRREIQAVDPGVEIWANLAMTDYVEATFLSQRIAVTFLVGLGAVALVLSAIGIYGVMAYVVSQRTHEIGVRMALGAGSNHVLQLVVGQGMRLALVGLGLGVIGAFAFTHLLANFLHGVSPFDPATFVVVPLALALVALTACFLPARRAARVDPMEALRYE